MRIIIINITSSWEKKYSVLNLFFQSLFYATVVVWVLNVILAMAPRLLQGGTFWNSGAHWKKTALTGERLIRRELLLKALNRIFAINKIIVTNLESEKIRNRYRRPERHETVLGQF